MKHLIDELQWCGLLYQQTDEVAIREQLSNEKVTIYCGFDPTGDSLHVGHLVPYMVLQRFLKHGHRVVVVVGGGTGRIGDPSGRSEERNLLTDVQISSNTVKIKEQIMNLLNTSEITFVDNSEWLGKIDILEMLRDYGKHFNINTMLARDSVQSRLDGGISFTEFSYQVLQAIDFYQLYVQYGCTFQLGGSDQWGNIVSGIDLIRKKTAGEVSSFGLTVPLITKADGKKFGKSESGAVWLDANKTSPYEFYQFWMNTADIDAMRYIRIFTFLSEAEILELEQKTKEAPHQRAIQKALAENITLLIHGADALEQAKAITQALFSGDIKQLSVADLEMGLKGVKAHELTGEGKVLDVLVQFKIVSSKREGRELLQNNALYVNGESVADEDFVISRAGAIGNELTIVRRGKKNYAIIRHK